MRLDFDSWMERVDAVLIARVGLDSGDLPEWAWRDHYDAGTPAVTAARRAVEDLLRRGAWQR